MKVFHVPVVKLQTWKTLEVVKQIKIVFQFTHSCVWPLQIALVVVCHSSETFLTGCHQKMAAMKRISSKPFEVTQFNYMRRNSTAMCIYRRKENVP